MVEINNQHEGVPRYHWRGPEGTDNGQRQARNRWIYDVIGDEAVY